MRNQEALAAGLQVATEGNSWAYNQGMQAAEAADSSVDPNEPVWEALDAAANSEAQWLDGKAAYLRTEMKGENDIEGRVGVGGQYVVYALPNKRVLKVAHSPTSAQKELIRQGHDFVDTSLEEVIHRRDEGVLYVEKLCQRFESARELFGNPVFNGELGQSGAYEQDWVTIPMLEFNKMPEEAQKEYIDKYIKAQLQLWRYGCSEATFNFQANAGLNDAGSMVIGDFGEMYFSEDMVAEQIAAPRWEHAWGVNNLSPEMREWVVERFSEELTPARLHALWGSSL
jgi:hypothetical protein